MLGGVKGYIFFAFGEFWPVCAITLDSFWRARGNTIRCQLCCCLKSFERKDFIKFLSKEGKKKYIPELVGRLGDECINNGLSVGIFSGPA